MNTTDIITETPDPGAAVREMEAYLKVGPNFFFLFAEILGIPGNVLSLLVSLQKRNRNASTCNYIAAMAVADTMVLTTIVYPNLCMWFGLPVFATEFDLQ